MAESIRLGEQVNKIISQLKIIARNSDEGACCAGTTSGGTNTNVPSGFTAVTITELTGSPVITLSDGSTYTLGTGEVFKQNAFMGTFLPAYTIAGGTWKWYASK